MDYIKVKLNDEEKIIPQRMNEKEIAPIVDDFNDTMQIDEAIIKGVQDGLRE